MIVSDSGPLIVLFKIKLPFVLKEVYHEVLVLRAVERESRKKAEETLFQRKAKLLKAAYYGCKRPD